MTMENRREEARYQIAVRGRISCQSETVSCETSNISTSGVGLATDQPLLESAPVELELTFPQKNGQTTCFRASGRVVWCLEHIEIGFQSGIRFVEADPANISLLKELLTTLS